MSVTSQLLTAANYALLAAAGITNTGSTVITNGVIGSYPTASITLGGMTATVDNADAHQAQIDALAAYNYFSGLAFTALASGDMATSGVGGGATYNAGNYSGGALDIPTSITLDAQGNANAVFIFKAASTTVLHSGASVILANGAQAQNVIWLVGSSFSSVATSTMSGTILADTSITLGGGTLNGRALAGVVTVSGAIVISAANNVNVPVIVTLVTTPGNHSISGNVSYGVANEIVYIRQVNSVCQAGPLPIPFSAEIDVNNDYVFNSLPDGNYILYTSVAPRQKYQVTLFGNSISGVNFAK